MPSDARLAIGMMSGTSADGIDAVALSVHDDGMQVLGHHHHRYPAPLQEELVAVGREDMALSAQAYCALDATVGEHHAAAAADLLRNCPSAAEAIVIGMHGQTICHQPPRNTLQIGNAAVVAARTGLPVACDLRRGDMALGGQGAPLVPPFHAAAFGAGQRWRVTVNLGGIANLSWLPPASGGDISGYDTGPANALMDAWSQRRRGESCDRGGAWAAGGRVLPDLLAAWLEHPYFAVAPPKSTGRGAFHLDSLFALAGPADIDDPADVQRTLLELSARTIADAVKAPNRDPERVWLCGGGAYNDALVRRLAELLAPVPVASSAQAGIAPEHIEAAAMAWLALRRLDGLSGARASVTGAEADAVCGALHLPPRRQR
ncbi:anhydro-N-acetylmuramic acid kinase [Algiphilus sp.]|uniref:anhydro-N-acetylmuramic acid kinase n=1 Tax=Algiphilus sp. TaxID=1872431 RepID=UPI0025B8EE06|nr:anhydro-N-acetylmuramic acid kinase [Algiphilus sp.]MCK5769784.1 anhydro-N-acetylmuramic acid kinase [Algiphilus sp.]